MTSIGPTTLNVVVPALPQMANRLASDVATIQLTVTVYLLALAARPARDGAAVGPLRPPAGGAGGPGADRRGKRAGDLGGHRRQPDRRARAAGVRRFGRHRRQPRHHPRSVRPKPRRGDDRARRDRHGGGADARSADRRPARHRLRLGSDLPVHRHHQRHGGGLGRDRAAGNARAERAAGRAARDFSAISQSLVQKREIRRLCLRRRVRLVHVLCIPRRRAARHHHA